MPYTHSLIGALGWSAFAFGLYRIYSEAGSPLKEALIVGLAVFSHWILDFIVYRSDLPLYDDTFKVGLGLWSFKCLAFALGMAILVGGLLVYLKRNAWFSLVGKYTLSALVLVMILIQTMGTFIGRPLVPDRTVATTCSSSSPRPLNRLS